MSRRTRILALLGGLVVIAGVAVWFLFVAPFQPGPSVPVGYDRCEVVCITRTDDELRVTPPDGADSGLVFYVGARVPPEAYLELAAGVARAGHVVVVPDLPLNFAVLDSDAARAVIDATPDVETWAVGGHSLGGAMAARFASTGTVEGLALLAAYPEGSVDLSASDLSAVSVYGTEDAIATPDEVLEGVQRLPSDTEVVAIEGGNHAGFGDYGPQSGDGTATISPIDQTRQTVDAVVEMMDRLES